ncbi:hypothetical protein IW261DRAFT_1606233 [Armillaria novae-zelandiae]|uniref:CCL2-like lectin domain-containing protein n=1 Tax=Armillaria novae-zelandiae TaxID=153914 RepID=A0AA39PEE7_9AGAR|nr:hypothetical protein IW261DRAFT_1606233 [Armillaria novae-zelandiae]
MSKPAPGTYKIINRVLSVNNKRLTITANAEGKPANVSEEASSNTAQEWVIADFDSNTQSMTPVARPRLQAAWGSGVVTVLPANNYVWTIRETDTGVTIQDGGRTAFWGVTNASEESQVTIGPGTGDLQQRWILMRVA